MRISTAILLLAVQGGSFGTPLAAPAVTLSPFLDTYVSSATPDLSYGHALFLSVETTSGVVERSYLKFDTSSLAGMTVTSATLRVWVVRENSGGGSSDVFELYPVFSPWDNGLTYTQSQNLTQGALVASAPSTDYGTTNTTTPPQAVDFDVTSLVASWASGSANHGLVIRFPSSANADMRFGSAEDDPSTRPTLTVAASAPSPSPAPGPAPAPSPAAGGSSTREGKNGDGSINDKCGGTTSAPAGGTVALLAALVALVFAMRIRRCG